MIPGRERGNIERDKDGPLSMPIPHILSGHGRGMAAPEFRERTMNDDHRGCVRPPSLGRDTPSLVATNKNEKEVCGDDFEAP
jgi:hypothetical protein